MTLNIYKKSDKVWQFIDSNLVEFIPSRFTINTNNNTINIVYKDGAESRTFNVADVNLYDLGSLSPFPIFANVQALMLKLEELFCPCFDYSNNPPTIDTNITIVATLPITPELNKLYKLPDDSLQFYNGTEWVVVGISTELEIIDPIPSTVVTTSVSTLVNEYEIGSFLNKKRLFFEFLVHKTMILNDIINMAIRLYNTTTNQEISIAYVSSIITSQNTGLRRSVPIDNVSNVIRVIKPTTGITDNVSISNADVVEIPINFTDSYKLRVYLAKSGNTGGLRQYYGKINLK